jgi:hypothetical protein
MSRHTDRLLQSLDKRQWRMLGKPELNEYMDRFTWNRPRRSIFPVAVERTEKVCTFATQGMQPVKYICLRGGSSSTTPISDLVQVAGGELMMTFRSPYEWRLYPHGNYVDIYFLNMLPGGMDTDSVGRITYSFNAERVAMDFSSYEPNAGSAGHVQGQCSLISGALAPYSSLGETLQSAMTRLDKPKE